MSDHLIQAGSTSNFFSVKPRSLTTGNLLTGLTYSSFTCTYQRSGSSTATTVTLSAGTLGTFSSGSIVETAQGGTYQFCPPNAAVAAGAAEVDFKFTTSSTIDATEHVILTGQAGGVPTVDANNNVHGLQLRTVSDGSVIGTSTLAGKPAVALAAADVTGNLPASIVAYAAGQDPATLLTASTAYLGAVAGAVWDTLTSASRAVGSYGAKLKLWVLGSTGGVTVDTLPPTPPVGYGGGGLTSDENMWLQATYNKMLAIGSGQVTYTGPVLADGSAVIVAGDDYADARALSWTINGYAGPDLTGATAMFGLIDRCVLSNSSTPPISTAATLTTSTVGNVTAVTVTVPLTRSQTLLLTNPDRLAYLGQVRATAGGKLITLIEMAVTVKPQVLIVTSA